MDWHEISECAIKNATIRPGSQNSKIAIHLPRGQTPRPPVLPPPAIRGARRPCPRGARSTVQWIGTTLGRLQRYRPTSRARRRTRGAGVCPPRPSPPAAAGAVFDRVGRRGPNRPEFPKCFRTLVVKIEKTNSNSTRDFSKRINFTRVDLFVWSTLVVKIKKTQESTPII